MSIFIQFRRWLIQPKLWRFVGFASAVVGLVCYALSSSFNYLFGDWNLLKIFLYSVFSFIICMVILFAKILQHSGSLQFKAHTAFFVLTITAVYSFFFDKVVNGKPDAYSLISCAAFSIMSLSLSRQTECGFEIDLLYFFLGCLIVQLMKIKLQLFFLGAGFSYCLIIIRSSFSSIDVIGDNRYSQLQDGNSVILNMDSLQLANTHIASASSTIDSPQLVISTDISTSSSMMEKLRTCVKALQHQNANLIYMLLKHMNKYVEGHSQFLVTDPNFMIDALKPETIKDLEEIAKVMVSNGLEKDFSDMYNNCRRECLNECLKHRLFRLQKLNIEDLESETERWIKAFNVALKILFPGERRLCDRIFFGFTSIADFSFMEICKESIVELLNFVDSVATGNRSPKRLFKMLEVFETLRDLIPEFEVLFGDQYSMSLRNEAIKIWKRLGEAIRGIFIVLEDVINDSSLYAYNNQRIMDTLEIDLDAQSGFYEGSSFGYVFLKNNDTYIVRMTKANELGTLLSNDWIRKQALKIWHYNGEYINTIANLSQNLEQDLCRLKRYGGDVQQLGEKDWGNLEGSEESPSQARERKKDRVMRTIVISLAQQFENAYKIIPPEDGFTWRKYGKKEILGFIYPRSYYRCSNAKLYMCRAKKEVQQLGNNPNVFEVRYHGGHSCSMSLKMPGRQLVNTTMDMAPTNMLPSSTSYSGWNSPIIPGQSINNIPEATLPAPPDGRHHPMMDNVASYLDSAIRSQQIMVVNGVGEFSYPAEMELLESILASKSEKYLDRSLRHFFMMNNWRYLEVTNKIMKQEPISGYAWLERNRAKVQQKFELYQRDSWDKVFEFLKLDIINDSVEISCAIDLMKEKLSLFNTHFTETCRIQCTWSVHDEKLRKEIIESLKNTFLPAYGIFIGKFHDMLKENAYEYIEYGMFDIHDVLDNLFLGNKKER